MAQTPFSLLLRRLSSENLSRYPQHKLSLLLSHGRSIRPFSTSQPNPSSPDPKPSSLSARMSFVFDQIDAIEREQSDKDQTLQRIRAWRQAKRVQNQNLEPQLGTCRNEVSVSSVPSSAETKLVESEPKPIPNPDDRSRVELVHPWPEWIELIERLVQQKYFDFLKNDEDETVQESGAVEDDGFEFAKDFRTVQTACVNFGKDRFDILRSLSRQDIQILVGYGCPSADKKVAFSGKLLRKHAHLDEGDVCSSCSLRSSCVRAFLIPKKEDEARTIDVMRILLAFAFDPDPENGSVENKPLTKQKSVRTVVRKLVHQIVKLSAVPIDPNLPPPVVRRPPPKVKQPPTPPRKRIGRDDVEMKKGDWICSKCEFLNFAKNTVCLQCDAQRPKRQLLPGEWECPECNFLNYRRNVVCFHCECKRPPDAYTEGNMQEKQFGARTNFETLASRPAVSNAWNFDFDDDESDGADVAAFEYPDSAMRNTSPSDRQKEFTNSHQNISRVAKDHERENFSADSSRPGMGFDDFDDFDDVNNYELETPDNPTRRVSANDLSEDDGQSESEDGEGSVYNMPVHTRTSSRSYDKPLSQKSAMSCSEDDYVDFYSNAKPSVHSNRKSNNFADSRRSRSPVGPSRGLSFGSDEESDFDEDPSENFKSRQIKASNFADDEDSSFSGSESDDGPSQGNRSRGGKQRGISSSFSKDLDRSPQASYKYRDLESDDDDDVSSHRRGGSRGGRGNFKGCSNHGVTRHQGTSSNRFSKDDDDGVSSHRRGGSRGGRGNFKGGSNHGVTRHQGTTSSNRFSKDFNYKDPEANDDDDLPHRNRSKQGHVESGRRGNFRGSSNRNLARSSGFRSNGSAEDFDAPSPGSRGSNRRFQNGGGGNLQKSRRGRGGLGKRQSGRSNDDSMDKDYGEIRNSRRIIER